MRSKVVSHFKKVFRPSFATIFILAVSIFSPAYASSTPNVIRFGISTAGIGNPPRVSTGWISVAQTQRLLENEFAKDGIKIEWIFFKGQGPAVNEAISNNQLDFTSLGDLPSIIGRSVGLDTRLVLVGTSRSDSYIGVLPNSPIKTLADLKGKRVSFNKGTASQLAANRVFASAGFSEKDIKVISMDPATAKSAFFSGDIDAFFSTLELVKFQKEGKARIIYHTKSLPSASLQGFIVANQKFAKAYPQITQRVVKSLVKAAYWTSEEKNRDAVFKLWGSAGSIPEYVYRQEYQGVPLTHRLNPLFDPFIVERTKQSVKDAYTFKLIRKPFDVDSWIDRSYLNSALKELNLEHHWPQFDASGGLIQKGT
ncbi:MAG: aliphatic sulfonate ABC transporter substrate-binding protein [Pseudomonadota bacterium]